MRWPINVLILSVMLLSVSCRSLRNKSINSCEDFLEIWGEKTPELRFTGCEVEEVPGLEQLKLVSSYSVQGSDAAEVEKLLQRKFAMSPLKFLCCYWSPIIVGSEYNRPGHGSYQDRHDFSFGIAMYARETIVNQREEWHKIPEFQVEVSTYVDDVDRNPLSIWYRKQF